MSDLGFGQIIVGDRHRDAVHVAVAPVVALETLKPGQHIGFVSEGDYETVGSFYDPGQCIGIVDPFLRGKVKEGDRFWMFLYPNTVTSLRHEWEHPAFPKTHAKGAVRSKEASEKWLREFCEHADCPDYYTLLAAATDTERYSWDSNYLHFSGWDAHGDIPPEFWDHVEVVTGQAIPHHDRAKHFSCSC